MLLTARSRRVPVTYQRSRLFASVSQRILYLLLAANGQNRFTKQIHSIGRFNKDKMGRDPTRQAMGTFTLNKFPLASTDTDCCQIASESVRSIVIWHHQRNGYLTSIAPRFVTAQTNFRKKMTAHSQCQK